jgi:aspartyl-tRNA(Asn)/glutamyl-tRNA(Gln) amidotransferase subunit A
VQDDWREMFAAVDFVVAPTVPMPAAPHEERFVEWPSGRGESANSAYVRLCLAGNVTGFPAISVPCGLTDAGLPLGIQVLAGPHEDRRLVDLAAVLEADLGHVGWPTGI